MADNCIHGLARAFCARCRATAGRVAVIRPDVSAPDAYAERRADPYKLRSEPRARRVVLHNLVPADAPPGTRAIIARVMLDLTYAVVTTRADGSERSRPLTKGRVYRLVDAGSDAVSIRCPMCAKRGTDTRMALDEALIVSPYIFPLPRIETCSTCGGDDELKLDCRACDGRGWVVLGQDLISVDLACAACVAELRSPAPAYTAPSRSGEPGNPRRSGGMGTRSPQMCKGCQMRGANKRSGLCSQCERRPLALNARNIRRNNRRIAELMGELPGKDA